ncbi:hypothetical protein JTE90_022352 [Oedothorax gibbosus]|uniref:Uncharacterized protein n=1 Tax=Oedothorax gibbosus TaxID=931172 RepID=A0AAV6VW25_9ARAC|nr:hypothetical protein JTE90_022352 [Oedothorax gibbosus]
MVIKKYLHGTKKVRVFTYKKPPRMKKKHICSIQLKMLKKFLTHTISAAGISHVMRTKSTCRRIFWIITLLTSTIMMMVMTYGVLQEYLKYPKAWQSTTVAVKSLEFPAVTICSRFLVPRMNAREAGLSYMEDMKRYLNKIPVRKVPTFVRKKCHVNPLCTWDRFSEHCVCQKDPCDTPLCYAPKGSPICMCSKRLCDWNSDGCRMIQDNDQHSCICRHDFDFSPFTRNTKYHNREFNETLLGNISEPVLNFVKKLKSGITSDLNDLDAHLVPEIKILDDFGISYDGLIISCNFDGVDCDTKKDFTTLYSPNYGKCYMFNYIGTHNGKDLPATKLVTRAGRDNGLQLYLQTRRINMLPLYSRQLGARVTIHDPRSLPFSRESGFDLRHRDLNSISIQEQEVHRLGPPFGRCKRDGYNETSYFQEKPYNQIDCERRCLNKYVYSKCNCYHRMFMSAVTVPNGIRACKDDELDCFKDVFEEINSNKVNCHCAAPCREKKYKVSISVGKINKNFFRFIKKIRTLKMVGNTLSTFQRESREDLIGVLVFYQSMSIRNITETSIYSGNFLISNIGGNLGLFLGLSLITFVEIAEFLFDVTRKTLFKRYS